MSIPDVENTQATPTSAKRAHTDSANLFEHGNTPFRAGYNSNGSYQSPTKVKSGDKILKITAKTPEKIAVDQKRLDPPVLKFPAQSDQNSPSYEQITSLETQRSLSESLASFEKEWNSIIDKYSNVEDQGDVVDIVNGTIVTNNGHIELLEDEEDTIWDAMFPTRKSEDADGEEESRKPAPSLLQQLGVSDDEEEEVEEEVVDEKAKKKRRVSLWDV